MRNNLFVAASLVGKVSKFVVLLTGSTFKNIISFMKVLKEGFKSGYTGKNVINNENSGIKQPKQRMMSYAQSNESVILNFGNTKGRASRSEYWWFFLTWVIFVSILSLFQAFFLEYMFSLYELSSGIDSALSYVALVAFYAVSVRRLHDTNRSGIWFFLPIILAFMPLFLEIFDLLDVKMILDNFLLLYIPSGIAYIVLFVFTVLPGDKNKNKYGDNPLSA
tara:strand:- start:178 stop:840 length:663 start_codon:yes stop_codon:yes gene_type:complete